MAPTFRQELSIVDLTDLVGEALLHLYDVAYLQVSPLADLMPALPGHSTAVRGRQLLRLLLDSIEALQPAVGTSTDDRNLRTYRLLELRYIESLSAIDVQSQLALSRSHYYREHARALDAVALAVRDRLGLGGAGPSASVLPESPEALALTEVQQMASQMMPDYLDLGQALADLLAMVRPAMEKRGTALSLSCPPTLPPICADRTIVREIFLELLNMALARSSDGAIRVELALDGRAICVSIISTPGRDVGWASGDDCVPLVQRSLDTARLDNLDVEITRRLLGAIGGTLAAGAADQSGLWRSVVRLPVADRPLVLVLDNHPDFISLVERYLSGHDWEVIGASDVRRAQTLAMERRPNVILMDVMLPGQDGWDLLLALKSHPERHSIPVIVCSVLFAPEVASALGAVDYLRKPISQATLLAALAPWRQRALSAAASC